MWLRPASRQLNVFYRGPAGDVEYVPDFVAADSSHNFLIETKRASVTDSAEVVAKARAAFVWSMGVLVDPA